MEIEFEDQASDRLETDARFTANYPAAVVSAYRKRLQIVRAAVDERDLSQLESLRFQQLSGDQAHQYAMQLQDQWRLTMELRGNGKEKIAYVVGIEERH